MNAIRSYYQVDETFGLENPEQYHSEVNYEELVSLREVQDRKGQITRVRILAEVRPGYGYTCDVSYIHATIDGKVYPVNVMVSSGLLRELKKDLIEWAKAEGVYAKGIGLLDEGNWSILK